MPDWIQNQGKFAHFEGRQGLLDVRSNKDQTPSRTTYLKATNQGRCPCHQVNNKVTNYLSALPFSIPSGFHIASPTKNISSIPRLVKTLKKRFGQKCVNLNKFEHTLPSCLCVHNRVAPVEIFNLAFMLTLSLRSIQIVQRVIMWWRCLILISFMNFLGNLSPKRACFQWKLTYLPILTPWTSCTIKVVHIQALQAWMQSQSLCLIDSLGFGGKTHCLEREASAMRTLHSLTHECYFLPKAKRTPNLWPTLSIFCQKVALPFVYHLYHHSRNHVEDKASTKFCGMVKIAKST